MDAREVAQHRSAKSCWIVVHGEVYDVTEYLSNHPGGPAIILKLAGQDATAEYSKIHAPTTVIENLPTNKHLGPLDSNTQSHLALSSTSTSSTTVTSYALPHLSLCVSLSDFKKAAKRTISEAAFVYISSAADTFQSHEDNVEQWAKISYIPRVLRDVSRVRLSTTMMGQKCALPFFIAPTGLAGLTHPEGEVCLARGAGLRGVHYCHSTYTSASFQDIVAAHTSPKNSSLFFQLYVSKSRTKTIEVIQQARSLGYKGLFITVDTPTVGNRDEDRRYRAQEALDIGVPEAAAVHTTTQETEEPRVVAGTANAGLSMSLNWEDLKWIRQAWEGPIALKGIQSAEDAKIAADLGVEAIYLSNHGGRQLHSAAPCLSTLLRIRRKYPDVLQNCEIYVDGGCTRGGDILKAICLGAKAVGIGRPFLYAIGAYGLEGLLHAIDILKRELETTMALLGANDLASLGTSLLNTTKLSRDIEDLVCKL